MASSAPSSSRGRGLTRVLETDLAECGFKEYPQDDPTLAQVYSSSLLQQLGGWFLFFLQRLLHPGFLGGEGTARWGGGGAGADSFGFSALKAPERTVQCQLLFGHVAAARSPGQPGTLGPLQPEIHSTPPLHRIHMVEGTRSLPYL